MTIRKFVSRINWRQILIHFIAFWFFIHAFLTASALYDVELVAALRQSNKQDLVKIFNDGRRLNYFLFWTNVSGFIGLVVAVMISLIISIKRNWFWVNALIAFIITYLLYRFDLLGWPHLKPFFLYLGQRFNNIAVEIFVNGTILLTIGLLIFFLRRPNQFIENNRPATVPLNPPAV
jgi:hypothetical protein